ncbi:MAG: ATP-binding protein [Deltaproteobacteria bacterium]|nr:ATP-binding protein [Deltaproteobacteria bacterium]
MRSLGRGPLPLFFDEVQRLPDAGLFLKGLVDRRPGVAIYATGSSSFDLEARTRESLAGRAVRHLLLPFSLAELAPGMEAPGDPAGTRTAEVVERILVFGGYPAVVRAERPESELAALVESFVIRDASDRFKVRNVAAFRKVLDLAAGQIGNLVNFSEWASLAGVSNDTVAEYVRLLEETHVVRLIRPFIGGKRAELTSAPKIFFVDNGVRNLIFGGFAPSRGRADQGALWENLVLSEMLKYSNPILDSIRYWRSKAGAEVDFVFESRGSQVAVEVKAGDARDSLTRSARSFIDAYQPPFFLLVNARRLPTQRIGRTEVRFITPGDFHADFRPLCRFPGGQESGA